MERKPISPLTDEELLKLIVKQSGSETKFDPDTFPKDAGSIILHAA